ncbi:phage tail protein [uncultured Erythrobacter sp.]|uniref:phage tail protein n=1 Tax=uncultured Erythrobacter sp. TaxID=263913 RepID=UPI0026064B43|nr:phage tail protein [uncultured Erythrobacter sp.]
MADDGSAQTGSVWPLPKFHFEVRFGDADPVPFQELSGLDAESEVIEYRHGNSPAFSPINMPGLKKSGIVTMKRGLFCNDHVFWDWFNEVKMNTVNRQTVTISLLDEAGAPTMVWKLTNAFPTKVSSTDLKSDSNEVAVDTVELAFETVTMKNG